ncbi:hypothetical protein CDAR_311611 [Caerostris darwini]|uniref:Uncharacterized protein n=1 Tax=Caerostris darwini TaxID=1538125 RepID=A0AAV4UTH9_9ARAC|nr:hypothetical protein CDAR_311611 [Caerostris darwini]
MALPVAGVYHRQRKVVGKRGAEAPPSPDYESRTRGRQVPGTNAKAISRVSNPDNGERQERNSFDVRGKPFLVEAE